MSDSTMRKWTARPTMYRGIRMRSRTEAKVAHLLDRIGMDWSYEGDAFAGSTGQYLPDFVVGELGDQPLIIEVKPLSEMRVEALNKMAVVWETDPTAALLVIATDSPYFAGVELRDDRPPLPFCWGACDCSCGTTSLIIEPNKQGDGPRECPDCEQVPPEDSLVFAAEDDTVTNFADGLGGMSMLLFVELALVAGPIKDRIDEWRDDDVEVS